MKRIIAALILTALAGQVWGTVGSIINSINLGYSRPLHPHCIYRDASYIYTMGSVETAMCILQYTTTGSLVKSIWRMDNYSVKDLDNCHLGSQYFCGTSWGFPPYWLYFFRIADGSVVGSFTVNPPGSGYNTSVAWDGEYYYVGRERNYGEFARYTPAGASAGTWTPAGWPSTTYYLAGVAISRYACNTEGRYLVAGVAYMGTDNRHFLINMDTGSFITSWSLPLSVGTGAVCGHSTQPSVYGLAYWVQLEDYLYEWAYEVDLDARGATSVLPASLGKIKAIYR
jgi:hypothetical protein